MYAKKAKKNSKKKHAKKDKNWEIIMQKGTWGAFFF